MHDFGQRTLEQGTDLVPERQQMHGNQESAKASDSDGRTIRLEAKDKPDCHAHKNTTEQLGPRTTKYRDSRHGHTPAPPCMQDGGQPQSFLSSHITRQLQASGSIVFP